MMVGAISSMRVESRDPAVLHRDVEIDAEQHAFAFNVGVVETAKGGLHQYADTGTHRAHGHPSLPIATAVSIMRLEKPHSLSYQDITRHNVPSMTLV